MGYLKIIAAVLIWSSLGIFIRKIELPNQAIIFYSAVIAGLLQFMLLLSRGLLKKIKYAEGGRTDTFLLIIAPVCFVVNALLFYFALRNTTIANAVLTHYTAPVFVAILAPLLLKENIHKTSWLAIVLSSVGLWFILGGASAEAEAFYGDKEHLGIIAGTLSGLAYAFLILIIRRIAAIYSSLFITLVQNGMVVALLLPFILNTPVPSQALPYLLIMGLFHSTIAPLLYVQGFRSVKASDAAILGYFEPVGAIILAFALLHEAPGKTALLGGALILFSGYMILKARMS